MSQEFKALSVGEGSSGGVRVRLSGRGVQVQASGPGKKRQSAEQKDPSGKTPAQQLISAYKSVGLQPLSPTPLEPTLFEQFAKPGLKLYPGQEEDEMDDPYIPSHISSEPFSPAYFAFKRRRLAIADDVDYLGKLPDEMMLKILKLLPKATLGRMAQVSHRLNRLSTDETLWKQIDVQGKIVSPLVLSTIIRRQPTYLRLARSQLSLPTDLCPLSWEVNYLDLSMAIIPPSDLAHLFKLAKPGLTKLSLEHCTLSEESLTALASCTKVDTLNLTMCYEVGAKGLVQVLEGMKGLTSLNLGCVKQTWTGTDICSIIGALPYRLKELNFSGLRGALTDKHIALLTFRLRRLTTLDLSDSQELTAQSITSISTHLSMLVHLALSRCYAITPPSYAGLSTLNHLLTLELFSLFKETSIKALAGLLPGVRLNTRPFSTVARPTVGGKRRSIWGERVRD